MSQLKIVRGQPSAIVARHAWYSIIHCRVLPFASSRHNKAQRHAKQPRDCGQVGILTMDVRNPAFRSSRCDNRTDVPLTGSGAIELYAYYVRGDTIFIRLYVACRGVTPRRYSYEVLVRSTCKRYHTRNTVVYRGKYAGPTRPAFSVVRRLRRASWSWSRKKIVCITPSPL